MDFSEKNQLTEMYISGMHMKIENIYGKFAQAKRHVA